ncbi:MAG TPA: DUF4446 family protein [Bacillota bacterium]|nr:DUF4446 family protein [Bacillota bacterium]
MDIIYNLFNDYNILIVLITVVLITIVFVWNIVLSVRLARLGKRYKKFMCGSSAKNFENMLLDHIEDIEEAVERVNIINDDLVSLKNQMDRCVQKCNIIRYNAFNDTGSDLSYSIAMLDNFNDGLIITSIYGRNESTNYAKPISKGVSSYPLSVEEELVLNRSLKATQI